jgi:tetratricopeptide (TPR) repeat protein
MPQLARLAEAHLKAGRADRAFTVAQQARDLAQEHRERWHEANVHRLLAEIELERDSAALDRAESGYRTALALAEQLGMRPLQAHCHLGLGRLYQRRGDPETAAAEGTAARDLFRAMDMTFWVRDSS